MHSSKRSSDSSSNDSNKGSGWLEWLVTVEVMRWMASVAADVQNMAGLAIAATSAACVPLQQALGHYDQPVP